MPRRGSCASPAVFFVSTGFREDRDRVLLAGVHVWVFIHEDCSLTQHASGHVVLSIQSSYAADSLVPLLLGPSVDPTLSDHRRRPSPVNSTSAAVALAFPIFLCFSYVPLFSRIFPFPGTGRIYGVQKLPRHFDELVKNFFGTLMKPSRTSSTV